MPEEQVNARGEILASAVEIVAAHLSNNALIGAEVPPLIQAVFEKLETLTRDEAEVPAILTPAVPIRRSVTDDYSSASRTEEAEDTEAALMPPTA